MSTPQCGLDTSSSAAGRATAPAASWESVARTTGRLLLLSGMLALSGCARDYVITLNNGAQMTTKSKPRLKGGAYVFKDAQGQPGYVPAGRVTEIEPASMARSDERTFQFLPSK